MFSLSVMLFMVLALMIVIEFWAATCILKAHFPRGRRELAVSAHQAAVRLVTGVHFPKCVTHPNRSQVLLLFNEADALTFLQLKDGTGLGR